jgi:ATP/ADP translocase
MSTKLLLGASALILGAAGVAGLFAPHELLRAFGVPPAATLPLLVQLLAAMLFAFSMMNWTAKGSLIGGIYNRPLALGNLTHFAIGAITLLKAVAGGGTNAVVLATAVIYALFAAGFALVFFRSPVAPQ